MKFQKINENVIRCIISQEEMSRQGVNIDDLMADRGKAEAFLQYVLSAAKYEVDFVTSGDVLNVQLSVLKDGEVAMMISDDQNATIRVLAEQFKNKLQEISRALQESVAAKDIDDPKNSSKDKLLKDIMNETPDKGEASEEVRTDYTFWSRLSSLDDCINMARALSDVKTVPACLYKYYDEYFMSVSFKLTKSEIAKYVFIMSEYSDDVSAESKEYLMVSEHGQVIISENAIEKLIELG